MKIFTDGGARGNPGPAAAAFVVVGDDGRVVAREGKFLGETTNNVAEYQAVILAWEYVVNSESALPAGRRLTADSQVDFFLDSLLVVNQLKGKFKIKERKLRELAGEVKRLERKVGMEGDYVYIPRKENHLADKLVNQVLDKL